MVLADRAIVIGKQRDYACNLNELGQNWPRSSTSRANRCRGRRTRLISLLMLTVAFACQGCVANKYKLAKSDAPQVQPLDVAFPSSPPLKTSLTALIVYGGPGSWKREALWDEYILTFQNQGDQPLMIDRVTLRESSKLFLAAETRDPWSLEKRSKELEKSYRSSGKAFARAVAPGALIPVAGGVAGVALGGWAGAGVAVASTVIALPAYYLVVIGVNRHNRKAVEAEFERRRLLLPLTLAPGATLTASAFYPMVRSPSGLDVSWRTDSISESVLTLQLDFLSQLHVPAEKRGH